MDFSQINWSTLLSSFGGVGLFLYFVWGVLKDLLKDKDWFVNRSKNIEEEKKKARIKEYEEFAETFTTCVLKNQEVVRKAEYDALSKQVTEQVMALLDPKLKEQRDAIAQLTESSNDMMRQEIARIYYKYLPYGRILQYDKEVLNHFYTDYRKQNGNSFVEDIMKIMNQWPVVLKEEDLEVK